MIHCGRRVDETFCSVVIHQLDLEKTWREMAEIRDPSTRSSSNFAYFGHCEMPDTNHIQQPFQPRSLYCNSIAKCNIEAYSSSLRFFMAVCDSRVIFILQRGSGAVRHGLLKSTWTERERTTPNPSKDLPKPSWQQSKIRKQTQTVVEVRKRSNC